MYSLWGKRRVYRKTHQTCGRVFRETSRESLFDSGTCMDLCQIRDVISSNSPTGEAVHEDAGLVVSRTRSRKCLNNLQKEQREWFSGQGRANSWSRERKSRKKIYFRTSCSVLFATALFALFCNSSRWWIIAKYLEPHNILYLLLCCVCWTHTHCIFFYFFFKEKYLILLIIIIKIKLKYELMCRYIITFGQIYRVISFKDNSHSRWLYSPLNDLWSCFRDLLFSGWNNTT